MSSPQARRGVPLSTSWRKVRRFFPWTAVVYSWDDTTLPGALKEVTGFWHSTFYQQESWKGLALFFLFPYVTKILTIEFPICDENIMVFKRVVFLFTIHISPDQVLSPLPVPRNWVTTFLVTCLQSSWFLTLHILTLNVEAAFSLQNATVHIQEYVCRKLEEQSWTVMPWKPQNLHYSIWWRV
jgi:hypothetical protein